jgi:hypothetical protein
MLTKYIDKRNSVLVQDEELVAASGGASAHDICAFNLIAENSTDLSQQARWFITDGQLWDTDARIENTSGGNVSDGNYVTVADNRGNSVVFEFDNDASVTGTNTSVTLGASFNDSLTNLNTAINAAITAGSLVGLSTSITLGTPSASGGESYIDIDDAYLVAGDVSNHIHAVTLGAGSNLTITDWTGGGASVSLCGFAWNHTPVFSGNALPSSSPLVSATNNTAMNLTIYCEGTNGVGLNLMGTIHYTTQ